MHLSAGCLNHSQAAAGPCVEGGALLKDHEFPASEPLRKCRNRIGGWTHLPVRHGLPHPRGPREVHASSWWARPGHRLHAHADAQLGKSGVVQRRVLGIRSTNCINGRDGRTPSVISHKVSNFAQIGRGDSAKIVHGEN
jgi:hypothetical protein